MPTFSQPLPPLTSCKACACSCAFLSPASLLLLDELQNLRIIPSQKRQKVKAMPCSLRIALKVKETHWKQHTQHRNHLGCKRSLVLHLHFSFLRWLIIIQLKKLRLLVNGQKHMRRAGERNVRSMNSTLRQKHRYPVSFTIFASWLILNWRCACTGFRTYRWWKKSVEMWGINDRYHQGGTVISLLLTMLSQCQAWCQHVPKIQSRPCQQIVCYQEIHAQSPMASLHVWLHSPDGTLLFPSIFIDQVKNKAS